MRTVRAYILQNGGTVSVFTAPTGLKVNEVITVLYKNTSTVCRVTKISGGLAWASPTLVGKIVT